jgi:hypothetical protein
MMYTGRPRPVDCGLQLGTPGGIGASPAPNLVSTNADAGKRLLEQHTLAKQLQQRGTRVRRELYFGLPTLGLSLERGTSGKALITVAACPDS